MITIQQLRKEYKALVAVDDLCLHLEEGDIFGFIGPNGAGKTTTIKMLATLLRPTSGTATIAGFDVVRDRGVAPSSATPDFFGVTTTSKCGYFDFSLPTDPKDVVTTSSGCAGADGSPRRDACRELSSIGSASGSKRSFMTLRWCS